MSRVRGMDTAGDKKGGEGLITSRHSNKAPRLPIKSIENLALIKPTYLLSVFSLCDMFRTGQYTNQFLL